MGRYRRAARWLPLAAGLSLLGLSVILWSRLQAQEHALLERRIELQEINLRDQIQSTIEHRVRELARMARSWEHARPDRTAWEAEAELLAQDEACQAIEWVDPSLRVRWVVPQEGNEAAENLDLSFEPTRLSALEAARVTHAPVISRAVWLVQGERGFLIAAPTLIDGRFNGFILGVFRTEALLGPILRRPDVHDFDVRVFDGDVAIAVQTRNQPLAALAWERSALIDNRGLSWRLQIAPSAAVVAAAFSLSRLTLVAGLLTSVLVVAAGQLAWTAQMRAGQAERTLVRLNDEMAERRRVAAELERARDELEERVTERTASLRDTNAKLEGEVEQRQRTQEALQLAVRELDHRVKNTLATVQAVAEQTMVTCGSLEQFTRSFKERLAALGRIHGALSERELSLAKLIELTVSPYCTRSGGVVVHADHVPLAPREVRALGMALHELATNAAKYGALSVPSGRVEVNARIDGADLHLDWRESGGPAVAPPDRRGVGTTLIEDALAYELGGSAVADYDVRGLHWQIAVPLAGDERRSGV